MKWWPKPFWPWLAEGLRTLAQISLTGFAVGLVLILWRGGWPDDTSESRIQWLGIALIGALGLLGLALFLTRGGIRSFSFRAGPVEANINEGDPPDDDTSSPPTPGQ